MRDHSFNFGNYNSFDNYGILCLNYDFIIPPKRKQLLSIPNRSGSYNNDSERFFDDRTLDVKCVMTRELKHSELRYLAYQLQKKQNFIFWDEPDKYYVGEVYDSAAVTTGDYKIRQSFSLKVVCEPFAYKDKSEIRLRAGENFLEYAGTAKTPTLLILKNTSSETISNIQIQSIRRK